MTSIKLLVFSAVVCVVVARTISEDPGPQIFGYSTPPPPLDLNQGEVVMKEAILYLTPSQIKAYEASQGKNTDQRNQYTQEEILRVEEEVKRQLERQNIYAFDHNNNEKQILNYPIPPPPVVEEPSSDSSVEYVPQYQQKWKPLPPQQEEQKYFIPAQDNSQNHKVAESYSYIKFFTDHNVHETPKLQLFHPVPHEHQVDPEIAKLVEVHKDPIHQKQYKLIPYEYKTLEVPRLEDVKEITKIAALLETYNNGKLAAVHQELPEPIKEQDQKWEQYQKELSELKYAPSFEDHKNAAEAQKFLTKIEKENALAKAEAILKTPPTLVRKEVSIKRRPPLHHGKERHHLVQRVFPDTKKDIPLELSIHKSEKSPPVHHVWKY